jgi:hypothetical protein
MAITTEVINRQGLTPGAFLVFISMRRLLWPWIFYFLMLHIKNLISRCLLVPSGMSSWE